ncbi:MAG: rhomboid family intramembrane serine protease, partial [Bacteroidota bacterium]
VNAIEISSMLNEYSVQVIEEVYRNGADLIRDGQNWVDPELGGLNTALNGIALGASGAIFGVMVAFAVLFPNRELFLLLLPVPVKAKYYIPVLMIAELYLGVRNFELDNVAHFAHLGGAVFGYILLKIWQKYRSHFY